MFTRELMPEVKERATKYPAIAILGPRQSGKTTLAKMSFPYYVYLSLEDRMVRERASIDPKGFLHAYKDSPGIILDEFQNLPELLSFIQIFIDEEYRPGFFILTGSQNFLMNQTISQSLAGRISIMTLLPLSIVELETNHILQLPVEKAIFDGCYPRIYQQHISPVTWYVDYLETYVERDIRQITQVSNLSLFRKFVGLCAGRIGQILNLTSLSNDVGVSVSTIRSWLSLLEASYIIFLLQPYYKNFGKRLIKSPKLYFYDTGLACSLLGITSQLQLNTHYLRGSLFESYIISEICKQSYNKGHRPRIFFWQESHKNEIDCLIEQASTLFPIEIKASQTISQSFFTGLEYWNKLTSTEPKDNALIYAGEENQRWPQGQVISWQKISDLLKKFSG